MSDIEKYIIENRQDLDSEEPNKGHMDRFNKRLKHNGRRGRLNFRHALQIAASVAIIVASGVVIVKSSKGSGKMAANPVESEFLETREYYVHQVNERYEDISSFSFESGQEKVILLNELSDLDEYYRELLTEYNANPGDERVLNAMIKHYQVKVLVMDQIIDQLEQINNDNNNKDENTSI